MADAISNSQVPRPPVEPGYFRSVFDGAVKGDFSDNQSSTKTAAQIGVGLVPIAGQIADARDTAAALHDIQSGKSGGWGNLAFAAIGWIPAAGDFAKSARKVGMSDTLSAIGDAFGSIRQTWGKLWKSSEPRLGEAGALTYRPATDLASSDLPYGTLGTTNRYGDIAISDELDAAARQSTLDHEKVHRFFSPSVLFGQEFRANVGLLGYIESHLLRRTEEGLAESWARFRKDGFSGIAEGWRFPLDHPYGIDPERVKIERNILIGAGTSVVAAGSELGDRLADTVVVGPIVNAEPLRADDK